MMEVDSKGVEVKRRRDAAAAALEECEYIMWQWNKIALLRFSSAIVYTVQVMR